MFLGFAFFRAKNFQVGYGRLCSGCIGYMPAQRQKKRRPNPIQGAVINGNLNYANVGIREDSLLPQTCYLPLD